MREGGAKTDDEFTALFDGHYATVLAYGLRRVDPDTARDVAAETFLVAWRQLHSSPDSPRPWLLAVARRVLANELRRRGRQDRLTDRLGQAAVDARAPVQVDPAVLADDAVSTAMGTLSHADQELLQLIGWEQLDQRAAAQVLDCSVPALRVRLHRARRRLRAALAASDAERGAPPSPVACPLHSPRPVIDTEGTP